MAQDDKSFAFVAGGFLLAGLRYFGVGDQVADLGLHPVEAVDSHHGPLALAAQVSGANGITLLDSGEGVEDHQPGPGADRVEIAGPSDEGGDLGAGRASRHFRDGNASIRAPEPLQVGHAGLHPQHFERTEGRLPDIVVLRAVDLPGQQHLPLYPGLADHFQWVGIVVGKGMEKRFSVQREGVERMLAAGHEFFEQHLAARGRLQDSQGLLQRTIVIGPESR